MNESATLSTPADLATAIEDDLSTARDLNNLADWIAQARQQIEDLRLSADNDAQLDALLRKRQVPAHGPDWSNDLQGMGLYRLHAQIDDCLKRIAIKVGLETVHPQDECQEVRRA